MNAMRNLLFIVLSALAENFGPTVEGVALLLLAVVLVGWWFTVVVYARGWDFHAEAQRRRELDEC